MLYPDKEGAIAAADHFATVHHAASTTAYWTRKLGKLILYVEKNVPLLVLTVEEKYVEVLAGDRKGWIVYRDWLDIEEIVDEAA
jgi:hypothetical protein